MDENNQVRIFISSSRVSVTEKAIIYKFWNQCSFMNSWLYSEQSEVLVGLFVPQLCRCFAWHLVIGIAEYDHMQLRRSSCSTLTKTCTKYTHKPNACLLLRHTLVIAHCCACLTSGTCLKMQKQK